MKSFLEVTIVLVSGPFKAEISSTTTQPQQTLLLSTFTVHHLGSSLRRRVSEIECVSSSVRKVSFQLNHSREIVTIVGRLNTLSVNYTHFQSQIQ